MSKSTVSNKNKHWTLEEDQELLEALNAGYSLRDTAEMLGRTPHSISTRKSICGFAGRFPATTTKRTLNELEDPLVNQILGELLNSTRAEIGRKYNINLKSLKSRADVFSPRGERIEVALSLSSTKAEAASLLGVSERTFYRWLEGLEEEEEDATASHLPNVLDYSPSFEPALSPQALLVRDVVLALRPYGVACTFEFEGDSIKSITAQLG